MLYYLCTVLIQIKSLEEPSNTVCLQTRMTHLSQYMQGAARANEGGCKSFRTL
ncbi:hypothetical protein HMPREF1991_01278 [Hoylesella loescheii DSM 19665 = JCM 12249 = ATCC 15930]|uniref:Uncharacterized protein n=1 Tax=Hoylesella loescheii DSM 19665 = JCM 12249 = ATCC 15930 TaxID=1122985 RepID=A0A069QIS4_HOYLO|nr:hypothetical protein HMPREF1991_01278 [Hoylesella loescheii DSM 19665 = JCM 12249 = ATCC 15930]